MKPYKTTIHFSHYLSSALLMIFFFASSSCIKGDISGSSNNTDITGVYSNKDATTLMWVYKGNALGMETTIDSNNNQIGDNRYFRPMFSQDDGSLSGSMIMRIGNTGYTANISGSYIAGKSITMNYTGGIAGNYQLDIDPSYSYGASLEKISTTWRGSNNESSISIDDQGNISGFGSGDLTGCVFGGTVTVPIATANLYQVAFILSDCMEKTIFLDGYASILNVDTNDKILVLLVSENGNLSLSSLFFIVLGNPLDPPD